MLAQAVPVGLLTLAVTAVRWAAVCWGVPLPLPLQALTVRQPLGGLTLLLQRLPQSLQSLGLSFKPDPLRNPDLDPDRGPDPVYDVLVQALRGMPQLTALRVDVGACSRATGGSVVQGPEHSLWAAMVAQALPSLRELRVLGVNVNLAG